MGKRITAMGDAYKRRYEEPFDPSAPSGNRNDPSFDASGVGQPGGAPYWMNTKQPAPVSYTSDTPEKKDFRFREAIRQQSNKNDKSAVRFDPITDGEVQMLKDMKDQVETAKFDKWFNAMFDPLRPGGFKEIMHFYPEFVQRRVQQAATDYEFAMRKEMIDTYGPQSPEDLVLMYMLDAGEIEGPSLKRTGKPTSEYKAGILAPYGQVKGRRRIGVPGASNQFAGRDYKRTFFDEGALEQNSGVNELAAEMYKKSSKSPDGMDDSQDDSYLNASSLFR